MFKFLSYYDTATITDVLSFIIPAAGDYPILEDMVNLQNFNALKVHDQNALVDVLAS
jgi:hypothetical protein